METKLAAEIAQTIREGKVSERDDVAVEFGRVIDELYEVVTRMRSMHGFIRMQCELGLQNQHHCAAFYALCAIYGRLARLDERKTNGPPTIT